MMNISTENSFPFHFNFLLDKMNFLGREVSHDEKIEIGKKKFGFITMAIKCFSNQFLLFFRSVLIVNRERKRKENTSNQYYSGFTSKNRPRADAEGNRKCAWGNESLLYNPR